MRNAESRTRASFAGCAFCHEVKPVANSAPVITKPVLVDRWLPLAKFNHAKHASVKCDDCHHAAQSRETSDVLIPLKANCVVCHSPQGKIVSECITVTRITQRQRSPLPRILPATGTGLNRCCSKTGAKPIAQRAAFVWGAHALMCRFRRPRRNELCQHWLGGDPEGKVRDDEGVIASTRGACAPQIRIDILRVLDFSFRLPNLQPERCTKGCIRWFHFRQPAELSDKTTWSKPSQDCRSLQSL